ncbi:MAG: glycosyltransferase family 4 protein [Pseudomonadota bacterium]|nr:glycosyltransferase family 4 protein [Pseudomonadota bacterium]
MKPTRLLVISELFLPTKGGTTVWYDAVYRRLGGKGTHIVTAAVPDAEAFDRSHPNSIHRVWLQRVWWLKPESLGMYLRMLLQSLFLVLHHRFDAVHGARALPEGLVAWMVARLIRKPLLVYCHGEELTTWGKGRKFRAMLWVYHHADANIANSEYTLEEMVRLGVPRESITLIYPGVDTERFHPGLPCDDLKQSIGLQAGQKLILSVGRLVRRKGFDQVIRAIPELVRRGIDARYVLIGIGEDHDYLSSLARELGVAERVRLLGPVSPEDLPRWYNACDVFIMANREINGDTEGFGMVFLEAAACRKPAIAGDAGGTGAAVLEGETGFRVDGTCVQAVTSALASVLSDPSLAERLAQAAQERAESAFSWDSVAAKTAALV